MYDRPCVRPARLLLAARSSSLTLLCVIQALRQIPEEDGGGKEGGGPGGMGQRENKF